MHIIKEQIQCVVKKGELSQKGGIENPALTLQFLEYLQTLRFMISFIKGESTR